MSKYIMFEISRDMYALAVSDIIQIVELETMVKTNEDELNVMVWKDKSIPVVDPSAMMELTTHKPTIKSRIILVERNEMTFGILVDNVIGATQIEDKEIEEPSLTAPRYVTGVSKQLKIFDPGAFLINRLVERFSKIYQFNLRHLEEGAKIHGKKAQGKEELFEVTRLNTLNWLIHATKSNLDESFIDGAMEIHNLIARME